MHTSLSQDSKLRNVRADLREQPRRRDLVSQVHLREARRAHFESIREHAKSVLGARQLRQRLGPERSARARESLRRTTGENVLSAANSALKSL